MEATPGRQGCFTPPTRSSLYIKGPSADATICHHANNHQKYIAITSYARWFGDIFRKSITNYQSGQSALTPNQSSKGHAIYIHTLIITAPMTCLLTLLACCIVATRESPRVCHHTCYRFPHHLSRPLPEHLEQYQAYPKTSRHRRRCQRGPRERHQP